MNAQARYWLTVPNLLTLIRILLTPFVAYSIMIGSWGVASILFFICAISDVLDGFIARTFNQQTFVGVCLDPIADKFFVIGSFCALALSPFSVIIVPTWFIGCMFIKELLLVFGVLVFWFGLQKQIQVKPSLYGKAAACALMASLFLIIVLSYLDKASYFSGAYLFVPLTLIMISALLNYCYQAVCIYKRERV